MPSVLLALALAAGPTAARALEEGRPPVAVVAAGADAAGKSAAPQLQSLGSAALGRSRFGAVDVVNALDPERAAGRARSRRDAEATLAEAEKAYNDLDTQRAARFADGAARGFQQADLSQAWAGYVRARVLKAACLAANGQAKVARTELEHLLGVAPDADLPSSLFAPDLLAFARRARQARSDARLDVRSTPDGAEVWVDGKRRGLSPVTVRGLSPGEHHVTLRAPGFAVFQGTASGSLAVALEPATRQGLWAAVERAAGDRPAALKAAAALASAVGAAQALLVIVRGDRPDSLALEAARVDAQTARARTTSKGAIPTEGLGPAASALLDRALGPDQTPDLLPKEPPPAAASPALAAPGPAAPFVWTQAHTGVSLMAGGVALAGAGGFFGYQALVKQDQLRGLAQTDPASQAVMARGRLYAAVADVLFASALAAGAAGGWFTFSAPREAK